MDSSEETLWLWLIGTLVVTNISIINTCMNCLFQIMIRITRFLPGRQPPRDPYVELTIPILFIATKQEAEGGHQGDLHLNDPRILPSNQQNDVTELMIDAWSGDVNKVRLLIESGANINLADKVNQ
jgi:hypothetical protein